MAGIAGQPGPAGPPGPAGLIGRQGEPGKPGPPGPIGQRGERGEQGQRGERGEQGQRGEKGEQGEKGERGERGIENQRRQPPGASDFETCCLEITTALDSIAAEVANLSTSQPPPPPQPEAIDHTTKLQAIIDELNLIRASAVDAVTALNRCPCPPDYTASLHDVINELAALERAIAALHQGLPERTAALQSLAHTAADQARLAADDRANAAARAEEAARDLEARRHATLSRLRDSFGWDPGDTQALL